MHAHLDLVGGIAGDMFSAAMVHAFPDLREAWQSQLSAISRDIDVSIDLEDAVDKGLSGHRFSVKQHQDSHGHHHRSWKRIQVLLKEAELEPDVLGHALGIFGLLAKAEAQIHNKTIDDVHFHEVGAWDCIIDIVSAAWLIHHSGVKSWSCSPIPWGGGMVKCAHGMIPVPAPATLLLLKGLDVVDDGIKGERVTPTGAAILAWLTPAASVPSGTITGCGYGFGQRQLPDRANLLRVSCLTDKPTFTANETIVTVQFDIDDMTGEMLAIAREKIRAHKGVLEVIESVGHGKKNRHISTFTVLCLPTSLNDVTAFIFTHTSTLGLRYWPCQREVLHRRQVMKPFDQAHVEVKEAYRPDGSVTRKLEAEHLTDHSLSYAGQLALKQHAETHDHD